MSSPARVTVVIATRTAAKSCSAREAGLTALPEQLPVIMVDNGSAGGSARRRPGGGHRSGMVRICWICWLAAF